MSKSLKQMAYDTIEAHQETIADLRTQLAKANERVAELESMQAYSEETGFIDLNKFAIEKKSEAFNAVKNEIKTVGGLELCDVVEFVDEQIEQLRKEQE